MRVVEDGCVEKVSLARSGIERWLFLESEAEVSSYKFIFIMNLRNFQFLEKSLGFFKFLGLTKFWIFPIFWVFQNFWVFKFFCIYKIFGF